MLRSLWFVRIVSRRTLATAWEKHADAEAALRAWFQDAKNAEWEPPEGVRLAFPKASVVGDERVVFNIKGNTYRLVVAINYAAKIIFIKFFGTHAESDKIDVTKVQP